MPVVHTVSYRTSPALKPLQSRTAGIHHDHIAQVRALVRDIASGSAVSSGVEIDLPAALRDALDAWLERRMS
jgi:hypothetical protein